MSKRKKTQEELLTLDQIKENILEEFKKEKKVTQKFFDDLTKNIELEDEDTENLIAWFAKNKIEIEGLDLDDQEDDEALSTEPVEDDDDLRDYIDEDSDEPFDDSVNVVDLDSYINKNLTVSNMRINDPVKLYLKEIGYVNLLEPEDEPEIARRIEDGLYAELLLLEKYAELSGNAIYKENEERIEYSEAVERELYLLSKDDEGNLAYFNNCTATRLDGQQAKRILISANLRLVVSIAKKYVGRGMSFLDLIQEGNMGLVKAVEKFDYTKGFKFSTYATWWIRQAITRAIADQARTIRIPVHMVETINKLTRIQRQLVQVYGREPTAEEIAEEMGNITAEKVREIQKISLDPVSLETPIGEEDDSHLGDFIEDKEIMSPSEYANNELLKQEINMVLEGLTEREEKVLRMRFGLYDGRTRTLEEVGKEFNVTRERIRQIEAKALRKLKHPSRSKRLRDFMDRN